MTRDFWQTAAKYLLFSRKARAEIAAEYEDHARFFTNALETWRICQRVLPGDPWTLERMRHCEATLREAQEAAAWWRA